MISAISAFCRTTTQTPLHNQLPSHYRPHKPFNSNFSPKIGCHGNVPQHLWTSMQHMISTAHPSPQPKRHLDRFSRFRTGDRRVPLYNTMGRPFSPSKLLLPMGGSGPPSNTWFPGPTRVLNPNDISIGSAVFAGFASVTDQQTD